MKIPKPQDRPDYAFWSAPRHKREILNDDELAELVVDMAHYSHRRFAVGRRFKLVGKYAGIPKGTCCTVTSRWPNTEVRWDKWTRAGYGALRREVTVSFELDMLLVVLENA